MGRAAIYSEDLSTTLHLAEYHATGEHPRGFWLYDETRGFNIGVACPTREAALIEALEYYQTRLKETEAEYKDLKGKVDSFVRNFSDEDREDDE